MVILVQYECIECDIMFTIDKTSNNKTGKCPICSNTNLKFVRYNQYSYKKEGEKDVQKKGNNKKSSEKEPGPKKAFKGMGVYCKRRFLKESEDNDKQLHPSGERPRL